MLDGGADVRYVAEYLGHENLESTKIYTRVSVEKLRAVHRATHPAGQVRAGPSSCAIALNQARRPRLCWACDAPHCWA